MSELNQDGLVPGQSVDFETIQRIKRQQSEVKPDAEQQASAEPAAAKPKRARASKSSD